MSVLAATGVCVNFGGLRVLDSVNINLSEPGVFGLVGPNGAGKTTLFGVLSGLIRPDAGAVVLNGTDVSRKSPQARARLGLARTFQLPDLFLDLTVAEHLVLAHRMRHSPGRLWTDLLTMRGLRGRISGGEREAVGQLLEMVGIADIRDELAIGQPIGHARLIEVARALALEPAVILLDEPSSGLDTRETGLVEGVFRRAAEAGVALLLVEHDVDLVLRLSQQVTVLDFGKVIATGTPQDVAADAAVQAAYLGDPVTGSSADA